MEVDIESEDYPLWIDDFYEENVIVSAIAIEFFQEYFPPEEYDLTLEQVSSSALTITGNLSNEVVTITYNTADNEISYASSDPLHADTTLGIESDELPSWIYVLMIENYIGSGSPLGKKAVSVLPIALKKPEFVVNKN